MKKVIQIRKSRNEDIPISLISLVWKENSPSNQLKFKILKISYLKLHIVEMNN